MCTNLLSIMIVLIVNTEKYMHLVILHKCFQFLAFTSTHTHTDTSLGLQAFSKFLIRRQERMKTYAFSFFFASSIKFFLVKGIWRRPGDRGYTDTASVKPLNKNLISNLQILMFVLCTYILYKAVG